MVPIIGELNILSLLTAAFKFEIKSLTTYSDTWVWLRLVLKKLFVTNHMIILIEILRIIEHPIMKMYMMYR